MMKTSHRFLPALLAVTLCSCVPEARVWWSPDGRTAVVRAPDALYLADSAGRLGPAMELGGQLDTDIPGGLAWLPDGNSFIFARVRHLATWRETKPQLPAADAKSIEELARILPAVAAAAIQSTRDNSLKSALAALPLEPTPLLHAAICLAWENDPDGLTRLLSPLSDGQTALDVLAGDDGKFQLHELCRQQVAGGQTVGAPATLAASVRGHGMLRISPDGTLLAMLRAGMDRDQRELVVIPLAGGQEMSVATGTRLAFDWAADSAAVILARPVDGDGPLTTIDRVVLRDPAGRMQPADKAFPAESLVQAVMMNPPGLSVLPDGRILFAAMPGSWPMAAADTRARRSALFLASADGREVKPLPLVPDSPPTDLRFHALSPDGKNIALAESGSSAVAVVGLATGKVTMLESPVADWQNHTLPAWRGNNELYFAAVRDGRPVAARWTAQSGVLVWGSGWPAALTATWLEKNEPDVN